MGFWRDMQRDSYKLSRFSGDVNAAERGTLVKRLVRRQVTRKLGRGYGKLWR
jgi:hypothetical protein